MKKSRFRQRISNRLEKTKVKVFEKTSWVAGNSFALMETGRQVIDFATTTTGAGYSAKTAAKNVANGMVNPTEQPQVLEGRRSAVGPMADVMGITPTCRCVATVPGATTIPMLQCPTDGSRDRTGASTHIEHLGVTLRHDAHDVGIACESSDGLVVDGNPVDLRPVG